jgi:hypothetical protein
MIVALQASVGIKFNSNGKYREAIPVGRPMRNLVLCACFTVFSFALQHNATGDVVSDFVTLRSGTAISGNNGSNPNAATLSDLTGGDEASQATVSRTFTNNSTFGSFVIDFTISAFQTNFDPLNIGVNFETPNNGIGVGENRNLGPGELLDFELLGIDTSSLNSGYSVTGYGIESVRFAAANATLDEGVVMWFEGITGGSLGNVTPDTAVGFQDMNDGSGGEEAYVFENGSGLFTWDFSQDDTNGSGAVVDRFYVSNISNANLYYLNRINLVAEVQAVPEPSGLGLAFLSSLGILSYRRRLRFRNT